MGEGDKKQDKQDVNDLINYKGIYFDDDTGQKYTCPETGAHFEYLDMYRRLKKIASIRSKEERLDKQSSVNKNDSNQMDISKDSKEEKISQVNHVKTDERSINQSTKKQPPAEVS